ncbi:hypothetical protein, partial [Nocardioides sp. SYSU DS0663]|uniref:hypothetical protein n=1 Tax=Nocardioides sp. SYSU DS0663 TaxID=3416445 RepID=UPI003F4C9D6A
MLEPTVPGGATEAAELLDRARALLHEGAVHEALDALAGLDTGHLDTGQLDTGHLDTGHLDTGHLEEGHLDHRGRARALATALECRLARGDLAEAMAHGDRLEALLPDLLTAGDDSAAVAHHARGELASALSEPAHAAQHYA